MAIVMRKMVATKNYKKTSIRVMTEKCSYMNQNFKKKLSFTLKNGKKYFQIIVHKIICMLVK